MSQLLGQAAPSPQNTCKGSLMMEVVSSSETSVNIYQTTRCNIPEDSHLLTRRCVDLKYYLVLSKFAAK
jgi:hypothetical protein